MGASLVIGKDHKDRCETTAIKAQDALQALAAGIVLLSASLVMRQALGTRAPFKWLADAVLMV